MSCLGLFASLQGCRSDDPNVLTIAEKYPNISTFCQALGEASCTEAVINGCGLTNPLTCAAAAQSSCLNGNLEAARRVTSGQSYRGAKAESCLSVVGTTFADALVTADEVASLHIACDPVFSSSSPAGLSCATKADCGEGLDCFVAANNTCQKPVTVDPGRSCAAPGSICSQQAEFYCDSGSNCVQKPANKRFSCLPGTNECEAGYRCIPDAVATDGAAATYSCQSKLALGSACAIAEECESGVCGLEVNLQDKNQTVRQCLRSIQLTALASGSCTLFR